MSFCGRMVLACLVVPVLVLVTLTLIAVLVVHCVRSPDPGASDGALPRRPPMSQTGQAVSSR